MLSGNMLPCVIREFDLPRALEPLPNLNAVGLPGRCLGLLIPGPAATVSTWETAQDLGSGLDTNCNRPRVAGWSWSWSQRGAEASLTPPSSPPSSSPSSGTSESLDSPPSKASPATRPVEFPASPSTSRSPLLTSSEFPDTPSSKASPTNTGTEFPASPSPSLSPSLDPSEFPVTPSSKASPAIGHLEFQGSPSMDFSPSPGRLEFPDTPSLRASQATGHLEFPVSPSLGRSPSLGPSEFSDALSSTASPTNGPTEFPVSPSLGRSPSPGPSEILDTPSSTASPTLKPSEFPASPSLGHRPCAHPSEFPDTLSSKASPSLGFCEFPDSLSLGPSPSPHSSEFRASSSPHPAEFPISPSPHPLEIPDSPSSKSSSSLGPSELPSSQGSTSSPEAPGLPTSPSPGVAPAPEHLRTQDPAVPGSVGSTPSLPPGAAPALPTQSPSPPPPAHLETLGQGSDRPRVTTFHELALRRRRPPPPVPRPPAPDTRGVTGPPPPVVTFRELRWRSRTGTLEPQEAGAEQGNGGERGKADGGAKPAEEAAGSHPVPGDSCAGQCGMSELSSTPPLRPPYPGDRAPPSRRQHKKGLVWAVSVAVDEIVAHFSAARNVVQKTQLGDSRLTPQVGHLLLSGLCPALSAVIWDGLKPYRQDLIVGRRTTSLWSVVEASVKADHSTGKLYSLVQQLDQLSQLKSSQKKFNAFIFTLLNLKVLDVWMVSLYNCTEVLKTHYTPSAFLWAAHSSDRGAFEELLLLLQPLSVLAFQLDPLFEYHHQHLLARSSAPERDPAQEDGEKRLRNGLGSEEGPVTSRAAREPLGEGDGYRLQETFDQVSRWASRLARAVLEPGPRQEQEEDHEPAAETRVGEPGWWAQLGESCKFYRTSPGPGARFNASGGRERRQEGKPLQLASLFGARIPSTYSPGEAEAQKPSGQRRRLPSEWLWVNIERLWGAPEVEKTCPHPTGLAEAKPPPQRASTAVRTVRTLCDHPTPEPGHLGFQKGDTLEVLGNVDDAWIHCRRGDALGLVPIEYTSLV
ncbi:AP-4 complex accessory subunit RUSC1 isoform X2 [Hemitrygon akajei]|uniref:AP-4 complex accessory subunit RUSC1 isoform X2 n=1 Tax=Hemitrygon akajei TaxID=2704970 RepID=UPI003BF98E00